MMRFKPTAWRLMPQGVQKAYLRTAKAFGGYDWSRMRGWDWIEARVDAGRVYAVNRSGDWYCAERKN